MVTIATAPRGVKSHRLLFRVMCYRGKLVSLVSRVFTERLDKSRFERPMLQFHGRLFLARRPRSSQHTNDKAGRRPVAYRTEQMYRSHEAWISREITSPIAEIMSGQHYHRKCNPHSVLDCNANGAV